jgi:hypothetical protein
VVGFVWSDDPESYVDGSVTTGRVSHVRKINGDDPDKKRDTLVLQVRGRLETDNFITLKTSLSRKSPQSCLRWDLEENGCAF